MPDVKEFVEGDLDPLPFLDPETARSRLYDAVVAFVLRLAGRRPLVLVIDDLHWADQPSLQLVRLLTAQLAEAKVLLLATYRPVEADQSDLVHATLTTLIRNPAVSVIRPRGLTKTDVSQLVAITVGIEPGPGVAEAIRERTEGNAFFVSELVELLRSERKLESVSTEAVSTDVPPGRA